MSLVSVIIPCYNSERYLNASIESILNQTHKTVEIICVDNGSIDGTILLIEKLQKSLPQLILASEAQSGASYARNKGLSLAKGAYIQFLDSDDIILPNKFEKQLAYLEANALDWVVSDRKVLNEDLSCTSSVHIFDTFLDNPIGAAISSIITSGNPLYRATIVKKIGGYTAHLKVGQDWDFHVKLILANSKVGYLKGDFFHSRTVSGSLSSNWFQVSIVLCHLITHYKKDFEDLKVLSNRLALKKIHHVFYFTALATKNKKTQANCINELNYWTKGVALKNSIGPVDSLLVSFLGKVNAIRFKRLFSRKED
jgi:glycosyltransferase involved in cell wall biosynthesis